MIDITRRTFLKGLALLSVSPLLQTTDMVRAHKEIGASSGAPISIAGPKYIPFGRFGKIRIGEEWFALDDASLLIDRDIHYPRTIGDGLLPRNSDIDYPRTIGDGLLPRNSDIDYRWRISGELSGNPNFSGLLMSAQEYVIEFVPGQGFSYLGRGFLTSFATSVAVDRVFSEFEINGVGNLKRF